MATIIKENLPMGFTREDTKIVKAIAIILMFYHHLFAFPDRIAPDLSYISLFSVNDVTMEYYLGRFGKICVALFTFLGGQEVTGVAKTKQ